MGDKVPERLARIETKMDDLLSLYNAHRTEQRVICDRSFATHKESAEKIVSLETSRATMKTVGKLVTWAGVTGGTAWPLIGWLVKICHKGAKLP